MKVLLEINLKFKNVLNKIKSVKEKTLVLSVILVVAVLAMSLKGMVGNPSITDLNTIAWKEDGPLELSPDRGRYALMYSVVEDHTLYKIPYTSGANQFWITGVRTCP